MKGYTFTQNWACRHYGGCGSCPFYKHPYCKFDDRQDDLKFKRHLFGVLGKYHHERDKIMSFEKTRWCQVNAGIEELESLRDVKMEKGAIICYIRGRIKALEALKSSLIDEMSGKEIAENIQDD